MRANYSHIWILVVTLFRKNVSEALNNNFAILMGDGLIGTIIFKAELLVI